MFLLSNKSEASPGGAFQLLNILSLNCCLVCLSRPSWGQKFLWDQNSLKVFIFSDFEVHFSPVCSRTEKLKKTHKEIMQWKNIILLMNWRKMYTLTIILPMHLFLTLKVHDNFSYFLYFCIFSANIMESSLVSHRTYLQEEIQKSKL